MATKRKGAKRSATKKTVAKARPAKAKPERRASPAAEGSREVHYTDLRKVMLANALKRLR